MKNFAKFTGKHLYWSLVFNRPVGLQLKQVLFLCQKFAFLKYCRFHFLSELYHCNKKPCHFLFQTLRNTLPRSQLVLLLQKACSLGCISKRICNFSLFFLSAMPEKQESTISESLKFTDLIYRILKIRKKISFAKIVLSEKFSSIDLPCYDKYH